MPQVTLVIPTNRSAAVLAECFNSVAAQDFDPAEIEVVIVFNGLPTPPQLDPANWPFRLRTGFVVDPSICAAKNRALELATGEWIILLNDDGRLAPGFVTAHLRAHQHVGQPALVLGASPFAAYADETLFDRLTADTSMIFFYDRMSPHAWYNFRHAWNLNLSFRRQDAAGVRFDERLVPVNFDDIEWAFRLEHQRGLRVWYAPEARLVHEHRYTLDSYLRREEHLGQMALLLWKCNPACFEATYGADLEPTLAKARRYVQTEATRATELQSALAPLLSRRVDELAASPAVIRELVGALYVAHRPLKRLVFYRGLLSAAACCPSVARNAPITRCMTAV